MSSGAIVCICGAVFHERNREAARLLKVRTPPSARSLTSPVWRSRIIRRSLVLACLLSALAPAAAHASASQQLVFDARRDVLDPAKRGEALDELKRLGADQLRLLVYWKDVAPQAEARETPGGDLRDPAAYSWGAYDDVMAAARERDIPVLLTLSLPGPKWAMRERDDYLTYPSATQFGRFVEAAGRRYGTQVATWAIGNEPNHPDFLRPQYRRGEAVSPRIYRQLFRASTSALDATGNADDTVLIGETLPRGSRGRSVAPLAFLRGVLCLNRSYRETRSCGRLDADGWAHHPYTTQAGPFFKSPNRDDVTIGTLSRLTSALDRAARTGNIARRLPIWLTEFGVQSTPDRFAGVSLSRQVEYRAIGERISYATSRVVAFSQYLLTDDPPVEGVTASRRYGNFESGLRFSTGREKPALDSFRLPLVALRSGSAVSLWGLVRPATGRTRVEVLVKDRGGRAYRSLKTVTTNSAGGFVLRTAHRSGRRYQLRWNGELGTSARIVSRP
jgi:hypothetical protein